MKKIIYALILSLVVVSGLVLANREIKTSKKSISKPTGSVSLSAAEKKAALQRWEASPDGIKYKNWQTSPAGKKVHAGIVKIWKSIKGNTNMEGVVTSLSLPPDSRLGYGVMVKINGDDYILTLGLDSSLENVLNINKEFEQLHSLKVNDKIVIRSHNVSQAPKYSYPIIAGDYVERDGKMIYKRTSKGGC